MIYQIALTGMASFYCKTNFVLKIVLFLAIKDRMDGRNYIAR
jgi:hypothetical protein